MIELECKTNGCDVVIPCDEGVVGVKCGLCCMVDLPTLAMEEV